MKLNFKRIASVLTGAVMLSSTVALAAAANFPAPYTSGDTAVVYGSTVPTTGSDLVKATAIYQKLTDLRLADASSAAPAAPVVTASGDGDSMVLEGSDPLHLGSALSTSFTSTVNDDDDMLPTLLASGTYTDADGTDFSYDQEITVNPDLTPAQFSDSDVNDGDPTIGVQLDSGAYVLDYTLDFSDEPTDSLMETTPITMMGKEFYVLSANFSAATPTMTLLDSATTVTVAEGSTKEVTVNGKTYSIAVSSVTTADKVKFSVNGKSSSSALAAGGTIKIAEGVYAAVKEVTYRSKESATSDADISIGTGKLTLQNASEVEANDDVINGLYAYLDTTGDTISSLTLNWTTDEEKVIAGNASITMPGFGGVKLSTTGMSYPKMEVTEITTDNKAFVLETTVKDGKVNIPILALDDSSTTLDVVGKETSKLLRSSASTSITYNDETDDMFVASWASGDESESYVLRTSGFTKDDSNRNYTIIQKMVDGSWENYKEVKATDHVKLGKVDLTVGNIDRADKTVVLTANTNTEFDVLYTKEGLKVQLPWANSTVKAGTTNTQYADDATACAALIGSQDGTAATFAITYNNTGTDVITSEVCALDTYQLRFYEETSEDAIGTGATFNVTLGTTTEDKSTVDGVQTGNSNSYEVGESNLYINQVYSALATTIEHDQDPTQQTAKIIYHGAESAYGLVLSAPSVMIGGGDGGDVGKVLLVKDTEAASLTGSNLIVVGGSCINTVAAKLLGSTTPLCGTDFTAKTQVGTGQYLIRTYESPYNTAKIATLVAGYEAKDTENAVDYLLAQTVSTAKGDAYKTGVKLTVGSA